MTRVHWMAREWKEREMCSRNDILLPGGRGRVEFGATYAVNKMISLGYI